MRRVLPLLTISSPARGYERTEGKGGRERGGKEENWSKEGRTEKIGEEGPVEGG